MEKKGMKEMTQLLEDVKKAKSFNINRRLNLTDMQRSRKWREDLKELSLLEVVDRSDTVAIMIEANVYQSLMGYIENLEKELENIEVEMLYGRRLANANFSTGAELTEKAKDSFMNRKDQLRGLFEDEGEN